MSEIVHRTFWFIGANVWRGLAFVVGISFQHVCGTIGRMKGLLVDRIPVMRSSPAPLARPCSPARLIGIGDPREPPNVTSAGFGVQTFGVPPLTFLEGCRDVDLHEVPAQAPHEVA